VIVCITEKPSVARDIAAILGANSRREGFFEGGGYCVTWTFGHLCCLKEPHDYTDMWKRWSLSALPMIPPKFGIKLIADRGIEQQFNVIKDLISKADEVINCGDAGQEGELIQRWVMQKAGIKCPVKRLWISSLTDESIRKGFDALEPEKKFENLYLAGLSRAIGDWILGMNATRLYTLKYSPGSGNVLSVGRVQTPTLALIVERHMQIINFKPEDYWELKTNYRDVTFNATSGKFKKIEEAQAALQQIQSKPFVVDNVTQKQGREAPLRLFDLTSLQVECNKRWGWTADETLKLIQSLYEKKVTTYPRVDTTYLSTDIYPKVPGILKRMTPYANVTAPVLAKKIPMSKKIFDNSKVTDHHAIIPTGESPTVLVGDEKKMYHLIAMRFIAAFYPDCIFSTTTVLGSVEKIGFKAIGKVIIDPGWRTLFAKDTDSKEENENDDNRILPPFTEGESGPHTPALNKKTTQPPKLYTEGTLLRAMETAGKNVDEEELREAMKENGIGRPSTRSAIIETLFKRRYIRRERKNIIATQAGIDLIATIHEELLKSAKLTGLWENKLRRIERGDYSAAEFLAELKTMVSQIVYNVLNDNSGFQIKVEDKTEKKSKAKKDATTPKKPRAPRKKKVTELSKIKCPKCGKGYIIKGRTAYGCSNYATGCDMLLPFSQYSADLTPQELYDKLNSK
jgi:DNA topoisomerase-3